MKYAFEKGFVCGMLMLAICISLSSCTMSADRATPNEVYPDASTPDGHDVYNGGIMDNTLVLNGVAYDTVTPALASKVAKWQGNENGFTFDPRFTWQGATVIKKSVMFAYSTHNW